MVQSKRCLSACLRMGTRLLSVLMQSGTKPHDSSQAVNARADFDQFLSQVPPATSNP